MLKSPASAIRLRGVRHNNLKNFDLDLPLNRLVVITGLSGSGKSSLAFDTLFAEGQRRYVETFSPYARQFLDRMDKPQVDSIEGIPPAIAIEQRNSVKTTRSTVGTMTELCDYTKLLWPHLARLHCRQCGLPVSKDTPRQIWDLLHQRGFATRDLLITFELPLSDKISLEESLALVTKQGFQRLLLNLAPGHTQSQRVPAGTLRDTPTLLAPEVVRIEEALPRLQSYSTPISRLTLLQDRIKLTDANRSRFMEACEQAYHFGKGQLSIRSLEDLSAAPQRFSNRFHCAPCDIEYKEPSSALFSFNHPLGACPTCRGFGRVISIDYNLALPDRSKTLAGGAVKPWQTESGAESQADLMRFCKLRKVPTDIPFAQLDPKWQHWVIEGDPGYGKDKEHEWPKAWYGIKGYFRWMESKAYKMHVRVLLSRYRSYTPCPDCRGQRFQPDALLYQISDPAQPERRLSIADFYLLPVGDALRLVRTLAGNRKNPKPTSDPLTLALGEVVSRLGYLEEVGLGYLTLDRPTRSLSGGETERVNLTTCLGSRLVNTLFVLDEPSVGLHSRDTSRLITILERLRDAGNTVVVVEHEASVMRAANQIIDLGPGHGESGGHLVFQGDYPQILKSDQSLTGQYLSGKKRLPAPPRRPVEKFPHLRLSQATLHNLKNLSVEIPLGRFVCLTGVSGSGKSTLMRDLLLPALQQNLSSSTSAASAATEGEAEDDTEESAATLAGILLEGHQALGRVVLVDQAALGRTPRSNPAVYIGAFDDIRDLFAQSEEAKQRGLNSSSFSFNSAQGQCERCRGAGFEKIEMQFLSDIFIRCPDCNGRRYREHILAVKVQPNTVTPGKSIGDLLEATVDEAVEFLSRFTANRAAQRAAKGLRLLQEVGLGYLRLGQPINTLSGGESQRLKLVSHITGFTDQAEASEKPTLFLFDEPTTGLHFEDVRVLVKVFQRLVDAGHSLVVVEHNLELIQSADWVIDLGPEAGAQGGQIVVQGTPETVARCAASHTGRALRQELAAPAAKKN